ncbi:desulfoferrodoxin [Clostridium acetireducens DSM 10703]|jgi:superoxide reductase|uniref:Desulfoferrodoxin n=1 Tax=Clostridium acetireducens DSM 10703 TaxID=1121290 RepID=A0A1E8F1F5_9CLOT|nr:desulfoferrodoxin [Clostridium acetireducens]OFI07440.1 desulfoferrodoxin [Clostridium acetireducens DSM 10703]
MTQINQVYKCELCGNIVEVLHKGEGKLECCGKNMIILSENITDATLEKHIPLLEKSQGGIIIKVGKEEHPMTEKHNIEWIEVITNNKTYRKCLKANERAEAIFKIDEEILAVRAYCNLHGLWKK